MGLKAMGFLLLALSFLLMSAVSLAIDPDLDAFDEKSSSQDFQFDDDDDVSSFFFNVLERVIFFILIGFRQGFKKNVRIVEFS